MRHEVDYHSSILERKKIPQKESNKYRQMNYDEVKKYIPDAWTPFKFHPYDKQDFFKLKKQQNKY